MSWSSCWVKGAFSCPAVNSSHLKAALDVPEQPQGRAHGGVNPARPSLQAQEEAGPWPGSWRHMESSTCSGAFPPQPWCRAQTWPPFLACQRRLAAPAPSWHRPLAAEPREGVLCEHLLPRWPQPKVAGLERKLGLCRLRVLAAPQPWQQELLPSSFPSWKGCRECSAHAGEQRVGDLTSAG